jgi:biopolymer transport protein ExbB/TolQ
MGSFLRECGVFAWPLSLLAVVIVALAVKAGWRLTRVTRGQADLTLEGDLRAIPFWGGVAVLLGFTAQFTGIYNAAHAISRARDISPAVIAQGFAESFSTTLFGMVVLLVAILVWFALQGRYRRLVGGGGTGRPEAAIALGAIVVLLTPAAGGMLMVLLLGTSG